MNEKEYEQRRKAAYHRQEKERLYEMSKNTFMKYLGWIPTIDECEWKVIYDATTEYDDEKGYYEIEFPIYKILTYEYLDDIAPDDITAITLTIKWSDYETGYAGYRITKEETKILKEFVYGDKLP